MLLLQLEEGTEESGPGQSRVQSKLRKAARLHRKFSTRVFVVVGLHPFHEDPEERICNHKAQMVRFLEVRVMCLSTHVPKRVSEECQKCGAHHYFSKRYCSTPRLYCSAPPICISTFGATDP